LLLPQMAISPTVTSAKTLLQALAMTREILDNNQIHPAVQATVNNNHADIVAEVQEAIANNQIVIVGMAQNPAPKKARKQLDELGLDYAYLASPQCPENVDRLALVSDDFCQRTIDWRLQRHARPDRGWGIFQAAGLTSTPQSYWASLLILITACTSCT